VCPASPASTGPVPATRAVGRTSRARTVTPSRAPGSSGAAVGFTPLFRKRDHAVMRGRRGLEDRRWEVRGAPGGELRGDAPEPFLAAEMRTQPIEFALGFSQFPPCLCYLLLTHQLLNRQQPRPYIALTRFH